MKRTQISAVGLGMLSLMLITSGVFASENSGSGSSGSGSTSIRTGEPTASASSSPETERTELPSPRATSDSKLGELEKISQESSGAPMRRGGEKKEIKKAKLDEKKLKICENHEKNLKNRSVKMNARAEKAEAKFTEISGKIDTFYTTKVASQGKVLSNYASLKGDIAAKKALVAVSLTKSNSDVAGFTCTGDNPKEVMAMFRADIQSVNRALKEYHASIKNFSKAVRALVEPTSPSPSASSSPSSSAKPQ